VAESESTVLFQGPSGSGKELFARAVHNLSPRRDKPYVVINCGTLPPQLFESEIFGYIKGAFTDAKKDKDGKLTAAEGGTVFFDEIGELPPSTQVKLLRLLQEREYEPLGSTATIKADIRVVAASNKDLRELISQGKFRDDLYFRLAVVKFDLPPLSDRREDIPYLVDHFISKYNAKKGKNIIGVSPRVMEILLKHDYSGNIRELENVIEYGFAVCRGRIIQTENLPAELLDEAGMLPGKEPQLSASQGALKSQNEEALIRETLKNCDGNRQQAAKLLGIDRTTLWRKMKKYGIDI
jgi:transcriptional regulator with PAS, ATPase and Fis domain